MFNVSPVSFNAQKVKYSNSLKFSCFRGKQFSARDLCNHSPIFSPLPIPIAAFVQPPPASLLVVHFVGFPNVWKTKEGWKKLVEETKEQGWNHGSSLMAWLSPVRSNLRSNLMRRHRLQLRLCNNYMKRGYCELHIFVFGLNFNFILTVSWRLQQRRSADRKISKTWQIVSFPQVLTRQQVYDFLVSERVPSLSAQTSIAFVGIQIL